MLTKRRIAVWLALACLVGVIVFHHEAFKVIQFAALYYVWKTGGFDFPAPHHT